MCLGKLSRSTLELVIRAVLRLLHFFLCTFLWVVKSSKKERLPPIRDPLLLEPATVLAAKIRTRKVKSEVIVQAYVDRIRTVNPHLNAVVEQRVDDALREAKEADNYVFSSGKTPEQLATEKPFLGVPFSASESIGIKGLSFTSGVVSRKGVKADQDSAAVSLMREAGAIPLCVTNVPELCMWGDASNKLHGKTNNPYDLNRIPGGSSGGEASLNSAGGTVFGLGSDIGGGIRLPAFSCGIFGHKPTKKIVSNKGQFPSSTDTELDQYNVTGPICRYAVDLLPTLKVLAGKNAVKLRLEKQVDLKTLKVYYTEDYIDHTLNPGMSSEISLIVRKIVQHLSRTYGIQSKRIVLPALNDSWSVWYTKITEAKTDILYTKLAGKEEGRLKLWLEFIKWGLRLSRHTLHYLCFCFMSSLYFSRRFKKINNENHETFAQLTRDLQELLGADGVFIYPTRSHEAPYHEEQILQYFNSGFPAIFSLLGFPVTQCPTGISSWQSLPLGVQVVSNLYNDRISLAVAKEIEVLYGGWNSPAQIL